ncbi:hypothetical protein [Amycolatopsis sp. NPDC059021]|uniref:hypothetical protein n=1 Tax=Amycolatopsis sp. NPDC059021 TaxID=3346704 RepID=UPI00366A9EA1
MNPSNRTKWTVAAAAALACLTITVPDAATAAPVTADCTATVTTRPEWTVTCSAAHPVTIRLQHWWHWLGQTESHYSAWDANHLVQPGVPWRDGVLFFPEQVTERLCVAAFQDRTVPISPQLCR